MRCQNCNTKLVIKAPCCILKLWCINLDSTICICPCCAMNDDIIERKNE